MQIRIKTLHAKYDGQKVLLHYLKEQFPAYDISYDPITTQIRIKTLHAKYDGQKVLENTKITSIWYGGGDTLCYYTQIYRTYLIDFGGDGAICLTHPNSLNELTEYIVGHHANKTK